MKKAENSKYQKYRVSSKNFKVIKEIKNGSFGSVYSVINTKTNKKYAAKVLNQRIGEDEYKQMVNREI